MGRELRPSLLRGRRVPPLAALGFIVVVLLIFNFSSWRMLQVLESSKEEDLVRRVGSVTRIAGQSIITPAPPEILAAIPEIRVDELSDRLDAFPDTPEYENLTQRLVQLKQGSGLAQILLLTPQGYVVADSNYRFLTGEPLPFAIDAQFLEWALEGKPATTPLYAWEHQHFQRDYKALIDDEGTTIGVVMGSISADYLESLRSVRGQVLRLSVLSSILLLLLGIWLYRMFGYVARLEHRALQKVRVEAMGALAGGMAHELRNPLAIIRALAEEIESDESKSGRSAENARDIILETQRLGDLATHFLSLSRPPEAADSERVNLKDEVERVVQLMRKSSRPEIEFVTDMPGQDFMVRGDGRALRQLLLNLLVNASEALAAQPTGRVEISLRERRRSAELQVTDNGPGIPRKVLARAFEPFYTTRENGTGLGLSISRTIAENFGGSLTLESSPKGTTATVTLPLET